MAKAKNTREYVVKHDALGSGANGPAFYRGDAIGPEDFDDGFDFDRLVNIGAVGKAADEPAETRSPQGIANDTGEPVFQIIPVTAHPDANVPQGEPALSPTNPDEKSMEQAAPEQKSAA